MAESSFTYRAFISYSHADHDWGVWLHRALERYHVPRRLAGAESQRRLGRIFRDDDELSAAPDLGPKIDAALRASDVLIVVCSPRSAKSKWVNKEIGDFRKLGREHRVFALIVDGTPHGAKDECFPEALKWKLDGSPGEPLAADVRKFGREDAALRLIGGILDVGYDDLRQREVRRRKVELRRAQAILATGLLLTAGALTGGWFAAANYVDASEKRSEIFAREANTLFGEGQYAKAMLMALYGDPAAQAGWVEQVLRPEGYDPARHALVRAFTHNRLAAALPSSGFGIATVSPDATLVLTSLDERTLVLRSFPEGRKLAVFGHGNRVNSAAISPDGSMVATGSSDRHARLWRSSGELLVTLPADGDRVFSVAFSPDGRRLLTGSLDGTAKLWSAPEGELVATYKPDEPPGAHSEGSALLYPNDERDGVTSVAFSPDGEMAAVGYFDGSTRLWRVSDGRLIMKFEGHRSDVTSVAVSSGGQLALTGSGDKAARLWRVRDGKLLETFAERGSSVASVAISLDGETVLLGYDDGVATIWPADGTGSPIVYSRSEIEAHVERLPPAGDKQQMLIGHVAPVVSVGFGKDGTAWTASVDGAARLWRLSGDAALATYDGHNTDLTSTAFSSNGQAVLLGSQDGTASLWPVSGGKATAVFDGHEASVTSVAFSPDGKKVLTGSDDGSARVWAATGGEPLVTLTSPADEILAVAFSPRGDRILTGDNDGMARIWPAEGGEPTVLEGHEDAVTSVAYSRDGEWILTGSWDRTARLWPVAGGESITAFAAHSEVITAVSFAPDGARIAIASEDGAATVWRATEGDTVAELTGHHEGISAAVFSPDGKTVLTSSEDGTAKLWPASGGGALATFTGHSEWLKSASMSPDGRSVLTGSSNGTAKLWAVPEIVFAPAKEQTRMACERLEQIGVMEFSADDYPRFPILDRNATHPCAKVWGFDPQVIAVDEANARSSN